MLLLFLLIWLERDLFFVNVFNPFLQPAKPVATTTCYLLLAVASAVDLWWEGLPCVSSKCLAYQFHYHTPGSDIVKEVNKLFQSSYFYHTMYNFINLKHVPHPLIQGWNPLAIVSTCRGPTILRQSHNVSLSYEVRRKKWSSRVK